jgi:putative ATP-dependent endonuclease of the OLD family
VTTHSPVAVRELSGSQLFVTRPGPDQHTVLTVGTADQIQGTIRLYPDAFLAAAVIVCEGATEVGLLRGLDEFRVAGGAKALTASGVALVDADGGEPDRPLKRATAFRALGYPVATVRDDDKRPSAAVEAAFVAAGGTIFAWRDGRTLEDELFLSLTDGAVAKLVERAVELHGETLVNDHVKSASHNTTDLSAIRTAALTGGVSAETRRLLGQAARAKKAGWFKSITLMEGVAMDIVGPDLENGDPEFRNVVDAVFAWISSAGE